MEPAQCITRWSVLVTAFAHYSLGRDCWSQALLEGSNAGPSNTHEAGLPVAPLLAAPSPLQAGTKCHLVGG